MFGTKKYDILELPAIPNDAGELRRSIARMQSERRKSTIKRWVTTIVMIAALGVGGFRVAIGVQAAQPKAVHMVHLPLVIR